jgi:TPR repeat protein
MLNRGLKLPKTEKQNDLVIWEVLKYKAELGDKHAEMDMGRAYYYGHVGRDVDVRRAREIFEQHPDDPNAVVHLGRMYHLGEGVPQNLERAQEYYQRAADMEDINAYNNLGILKQNMGQEEEGRRLMGMAADRGHLGAMFNLAMGQISKGEVREAMKKLEVLAQNGMTLGQYQLAWLLTTSDVQYDEWQASLLLSEIMKKGPWLKLCTLAEEYWAEGNREAATLLWMEGADFGSDIAAHNAGLVLLYGDLKFANRFKMATRMFKWLDKLGGRDWFEHLYESYTRRGEVEKAKESLLRSGNSAISCFLMAMAIFKGQLEPSLMCAIRNLTLAHDLDERYKLAAIVLGGPRMVKMAVLRSVMFISGKCSEMEKEDLFGFFGWLGERYLDELMIGLSLVSLVLLGKKRVEIMLEEEAFG